MIVLSGAKCGKKGRTSTHFCGKSRSDLNLGLWEKLNSANLAEKCGKVWENVWENDHNFFPLSGFPRTLVRNWNLILVERGTGLEPATSTLGISSVRPLASARLASRVQSRHEPHRVFRF